MQIRTLKLQRQWDMSKLNLVLRDSDWTVFHAHIFEGVFKKHFNYCVYDPSVTYNKLDTVFVSNVISRDGWHQQMLSKGYKVAIDNIWETPVSRPDCLTISTPNWFWYNQCMINKANGYSNYVPDKKYSKLAFMPMRLVKDHRNDLIRLLGEQLDDILYSYVSKGIYLPNDIPHDLTTPGPFQQNFNKEWYDATYFSIVAETYVNHSDKIFVTEKTFKPLGFFHPFIVLGQPGTLQFLRNNGFETYSELFDESYDSVIDYRERLKLVVKQIVEFQKQDYSTLTWDKLKYNFNLLNNVELVETKLVNEVVAPIYEYVEQ